MQILKIPKSSVMLLLWAIVVMLILPLHAFAQGARKVKGTVTDELNEPLIGVTILIQGTSNGTVTDFDGNYTIDVPSGTQSLEFSYVGYQKKVVPVTTNVINVQLDSDQKVLQELVVIGYGTQKKTDLTGAISTIGTKDFNQGVISSPEQLVNGKVSGVQIVNSGGSPSAGASIRIRGGASLNASNDPLIVIDGVPMEVSGGVSGSGNPLSLINPNDIETMTVLKDASSTAIYGSRASNGVIIITTKKGKSGDLRPRFSFSTTNNFQTVAKTVDMLSGEQMRAVVAQLGSAKQKGIAGVLNAADPDYAEAKSYYDQIYATGANLGGQTDWNNQVYQDAFGTDNNLSISGSMGKGLPYRISVGYMHQAGILRKDWSQRGTASINLSPAFFDNYLKFNISAKGTTNDNRFANKSAIWGAAVHNPYAPLYSNDGSYFGYYEAANENGPITGALGNPRGLLENTYDKSNVKRFVGNVDADYKLHIFPDLRIHATVGYDYAHGKGTVYVPAGAYQAYNTGGSYNAYGPEKNINKLLTLYMNYHKELEGKLPQSIDVTAGYDYQHWRSLMGEYNTYNAAQETILSTTAAKDERHTLLSYYGRVNYTLLDRYMLTATVRRDASSRFKDGKRWGTFPSVALAYNIAREGFFEKASNVINDLKLRASYGVTGQQDGIANYGYQSLYYGSQMGAHYMFGGMAYPSYRPSVINEDLTWETTKSFNVGIDLGLLNNRFTASVDFYTRKTEDLLATVPVAAGTNFNKSMMRNIGNVDSKGIEVAFNANIISTNDWQWNVSGNATWQKVRIANLSTGISNGQVNTPQGWVDSHYVQVFTEGYAPYSFYVFKQIYDEATGRPVEGLYADLNGDGKIDDNDRYRYHSPAPDWLFGLSTRLQYKNLYLSTSLRANLGNYVYNQQAMNTGAWETVFYNDYQMNMLHNSYLDTRFNLRQYESDHYVENASFIKMDNIQIGYNFGKVSKYLSLNMSLMVQNVFTITKYSGIDPEVAGGLDNQLYPRPRTYSMTIGLEF